MEAEGKSWVSLGRTLGGSDFVFLWPGWQPELQGPLWATCDLDSAQAHPGHFIFVGHITLLVLFFQSFKHVNSPQLMAGQEQGMVWPLRPSLADAVKGMEWDWFREDHTRASLFFFVGVGACHVEGDSACHSPQLMDIQAWPAHLPRLQVMS